MWTNALVRPTETYHDRGFVEVGTWIPDRDDSDSQDFYEDGDLGRITLTDAKGTEQPYLPMFSFRLNSDAKFHKVMGFRLLFVNKKTNELMRMVPRDGSYTLVHAGTWIPIISPEADFVEEVD